MCVHNNTDETIALDVVAIDDAGERYEGTTVRVGARRATGFNTWHLERGDPKRLSAFPGVGDGEGMWQLEVSTVHDIGFRGYARVPGGFVTPSATPYPRRRRTRATRRHHLGLQRS